MISVNKATQLVLEHRLQLPIISTSLEKARGEVLAETLRADRDFPPFDRVMMDGIAVRFADFQKGQRVFPVQGLQAAGGPAQELAAASCLEIMTGAIMAQAADTVIRYEDVDIQDGQARVLVEEIKKGQNIHLQGSDRQAGDLLVPVGKKISAAEINVAATIGQAQLQVFQKPSMTLFSTGDELVPVGETPLPYQIRMSNIYAVQNSVADYVRSAEHRHINDEPATIRKHLQMALEESAVIVLSGGVSKGKLDFIPDILEELGVEKLFHRVRQRPGKPFWFGKAPNGTIVFALPGNPVSTFMCTQRYLLPWLRASLGLSPFSNSYAILKESVTFKPDLQLFLPIKLMYTEDGKTWAQPVAGQGSGDLANLVNTDAFLELPQEKKVFNAGESYRVIAYRSF